MSDQTQPRLYTEADMLAAYRNGWRDSYGRRGSLQWHEASWLRRLRAAVAASGRGVVRRAVWWLVELVGWSLERRLTRFPRLTDDTETSR